MVTTAFIPARAGSKGVPRKNLRPVGGRPLIEHTIACAQATPALDRVVVTTDCAETAALARTLGTIVVDRPPELATDASPTWPAIAHAEQSLAASGAASELIVLLQCTCPLRRPVHITEALALFDDPSIGSVTSVVQVGDEHPARMYRLETGRLVSLDPRFETARRQDLPPVFRRNGVLYAQRRSAFWARETFIGGDTVAYIMDLADSLNIDSEVDLRLADLMLSAGG